VAARAARGRLRCQALRDYNDHNTHIDAHRGDVLLHRNTNIRRATGTRVVTSGTFDAPISGNAAAQALPDSVGGKFSATLNGTAWNAAIVSAGTSLGYISLSGINDRQTLIFTLPQPTTTGTYQVSNAPGFILKAWDPSAVAPAGARCCWGNVGDVGTITFTSLTKTRARGTLSATLTPQPGTAATGLLVIANATFDVGLFHNP
jgi:hypothetical protein